MQFKKVTLIIVSILCTAQPMPTHTNPPTISPLVFLGLYAGAGYLYLSNYKPELWEKIKSEFLAKRNVLQTSLQAIDWKSKALTTAKWVGGIGTVLFALGLIKKYRNYKAHQAIAQGYSSQALGSHLLTEQNKQKKATFYSSGDFALAFECQSFLNKYSPYGYGKYPIHTKLIDKHISTITNLINEGANPYVVCIDVDNQNTESAYRLMTQHAGNLKDDALTKQVVAILEKSKHTKPKQ